MPDHSLAERHRHAAKYHRPRDRRNIERQRFRAAYRCLRVYIQAFPLNDSDDYDNSKHYQAAARVLQARSNLRLF